MFWTVLQHLNIHSLANFLAINSYGRDKIIDSIKMTIIYINLIPFTCRVNFIRENISCINKGYPVCLIQKEKAPVIAPNIKTNRHCLLYPISMSCA